MRTRQSKLHPRVVIAAGAVLLAVLTVLGIYGLFTQKQAASTPDISSWQWQTVDDGRVTLLSPGTLEQTQEPGGQLAWQTPDSVMPYIRLVRLGEVPGSPAEETLKTQLGELLTEITAGERALESPYFFIDKEGTAYMQALTEPEGGLVSATRVFVAQETMYCLYLTTLGDFTDIALLEMFDTFFDSVDITKKQQLL